MRSNGNNGKSSDRFFTACHCVSVRLRVDEIFEKLYQFSRIKNNDDIRVINLKKKKSISKLYLYIIFSKIYKQSGKLEPNQKRKKLEKISTIHEFSFIHPRSRFGAGAREELGSHLPGQASSGLQRACRILLALDTSRLHDTCGVVHTCACT